MNTRGAVPIIVIYVIAGLGATQLVPNWRPSHWFKKQPPVVAISADQEALAKAQADLEAVKAKLAEQQAAVESAKQAQLRNAQENVAGSQEALSRVPRQNLTPEVRLAQSFNNRALVGLSASIGGLPAAQQKEIADLVTGALSQVESERDDALAKLKQKDIDLAVATAERQRAEAQIAPLQTKASALEVTAQTTQKDLVAKTQEVVKWVQDKQASDREAGNLRALWERVKFWIVVAAVLYVFFHYSLPSLAAKYPQVAILQRTYRFVTSILSSHPIV